MQLVAITLQVLHKAGEASHIWQLNPDANVPDGQVE